MAKRIKGKKKVVASVGMLTAAVCCFGVAGATNSLVQTFDAKTIPVYAEAEKDWAAQWTVETSKLMTLDPTVDQVTYTDYVTAYLNARDAFINMSEKPASDDPFKLVFDEAQSYVGVEVECYEYITVTLTAKLNSKLYWSDNEEFVEYMSKINDLSDFAKVDLSKRAVKYEEKIATAQTEFERISGAITTAINAIDALEYEGMVDSKASLDNATQAIYDIYGVSYEELQKSNPEEVTAMHTYINNLAEYDSALSAYNKIVEDCAEFDARIVDLYDAFTKEDGEYYKKYYTQQSLIINLNNEYETLDDVANDNRKTLITEYEKLSALVGFVDSENAAKASVEGKIAEIPQTFDYTNDYILIVAKARALFDLLSDDVKSVAETDVAGYSNLISAETSIRTCKTKVDELIKAAKELEVLYTEGSADFTTAVNTVTGERAKLVYDKQVADFDAECGDLLEQMQSKMANLSTSVAPVIQAINDIGVVNLKDTGIAIRIETARGLYDALETTLEKNAVTNYNTLVEAENTLSSLMQAAEDWKKAVLAITVENQTLTMTNYNEIWSVEQTFLGFDEDFKYVIEHSANYGYDVYAGLLELRTATNNAIKALANNMAAIPTDLAVISADVTAFTTAVENATIELAKLHETVVVESFTKDNAANKASYENYVAALNIYNNVYKLVGKIIALGDGTSVTLLDYDNVHAYLEEYETLSDENKQIVIDGGYKTILDTAIETVEQIKKDRDAWIEKVYALAGEVEKDSWESDLFKVELDAITDLETERVSFALNGDIEYLAQADADLAKIKEIGLARVQDLNDKIDVLTAKAELENEDIDTLLYIEQVYGKLHEDQKDDVKHAEFSILYNKYISAQNFDKAVDALYNDVVVNGNYTTEVPVTVGILRSIYVDFSSEMKALIESYSKIQEIEDAYIAFAGEEGNEVLNLTEVYKELAKNLSTDVSDFAEQLKVVSEKIAEIEKSYADADKILKEAYEKADGELKASIEGLQTELGTIKTSLENATVNISNINTALDDIRSEIAGTKNELNTIVEGVKAELKAEISALEGKLNSAKAELAKADADNKKELVEKIDALQTQLDKAVATLEQADVDNLATIRSEIAGAKSELNTIVEGVKTELKAEISALEGKLNSAKAELEKADADNKKELIEKIDALQTQLENIKTALEGTDATVIEDIAKVRDELSKVNADINVEIESLEKALKDLETKLENADVKNKDELMKQIDSLRSSLTTVTIILSVVLTLTIAGVVVLVIKKKKA